MQSNSKPNSKPNSNTEFPFTFPFSFDPPSFRRTYKSICIACEAVVSSHNRSRRALCVDCKEEIMLMANIMMETRKIAENKET
jgi:hypothetical protein